MRTLQGIPPIIFVLIATILEVSGDAIIRSSIYDKVGIARLGMMLFGGLLVFAYGITLNLAPIEFREVVGLYIATLFIVWQVINYLTFHTAPTLPIIIGGVMIVLGGLIINFWKV